MAARNSTEGDRWRELVSMLAVVAALAGGAAAAPGGPPDRAVGVALCGEDCQHNQVLLTGSGHGSGHGPGHGSVGGLDQVVAPDLCGIEGCNHSQVLL